MKQEDKNSNQIVPKDIVKDIFDRKAGRRKVSTIFTPSKPSAKVMPPGPKREVPSYPLRPLPVAIDIGTTGIRLLQLAEGEKNRLEIVCIDEESVSPGTDSATSIRSALENIINRNRTGPLCFTTLSTKDVQLYNMLFPPMSEEELITAIRYKVMQLKPFNSDIEKLIIRFSKWDDRGDLSKGSRQRIIVACLNRDVVEDRISLLEEIGLRPVKIGIEPFDLVNLSKFYRPGGLKDEVTLWIDFGAERTFLAIEKGGSLCFSRNLTLTSKYMTKVLAQYCGVNEGEAEDLKRNYGLIFWSPDKKIPAFYESAKPPGGTEDKSEKVYYALISHLNNLVVDIMHSFKYFSYQVAQSQITRFDRVVLCGGGANLKNLDKFLSARLGVPVERINPFGLFKLSGAREDLIKASSNFALCAGLAVSSKAEEPKQVNLLPEREKRPPWIFAGVIRQWPVMTTTLAIILAISLAGVQIERLRYYKREMDSLVKKVATTKAQLGNMQAVQLNLNKEEAELLNRKALLKARLNLAQKGLRIPEDFSGKLTIIAGLLPEDIWITKLSYKDRKLIIIGSTADMSLISTLVEDIKSSKEFVDADFNYTEKDFVRGVYNFEIVAELG
jgi:type IV pilus assembly protein PilM